MSVRPRHEFVETIDLDPGIWSPWYDRKRIAVEKGERWFYSERDALEAGETTAPTWTKTLSYRDNAVYSPKIDALLQVLNIKADA